MGGVNVGYEVVVNGWVKVSVCCWYVVLLKLL